MDIPFGTPPSLAPTGSSQAAPAAGGGATPLFGEDGFGFDDLLDVINPLQHIPIVSTIYRAITHDQLDAAPRIMGGALFGGVIGFAAATANALLEATSGKDLGDHVATALLGDDFGKENEGSINLASTAPQENTAAPWYLANGQGSGERVKRTPDDILVAASPQKPASTNGDGELSWLKSANVTSPVNPGIKEEKLPWLEARAVVTERNPSKVEIVDLPVQSVSQGKKGLSSGAPSQATQQPPADFASSMLSGLDKYRKMARNVSAPANAKPISHSTLPNITKLNRAL